MKINNPVGRPKSKDPKMRFDVRLKTSTIIDIEVISEKLGMSKSQFFQETLEAEIKKQKELLGIL